MNVLFIFQLEETIGALFISTEKNEGPILSKQTSYKCVGLLRSQVQDPQDLGAPLHGVSYKQTNAPPPTQSNNKCQNNNENKCHNDNENKCHNNKYHNDNKCHKNNNENKCHNNNNKCVAGSFHILKCCQGSGLEGLLITIPSL